MLALRLYTHPLIICATACCLSSCGPSPYSRTTDSGIAISGVTQSGKQIGTWSYQRPDGSTQAQGDWVDDHQSGPWNYTRADGSTEARVTYRMGLRQGWGTFYYPNGKPSSHGFYWMDRQDGYWRFYTADSKQLAAGSFDKGARCLEWNFAGKRHGCYANGHKVSWWFENGTWTDYGKLPNATVSSNHPERNDQHWHMAWADQALSIRRNANGSIQEAVLHTAETSHVQLGSAGDLFQAYTPFNKEQQIHGHCIFISQEPAAEIHMTFNEGILQGATALLDGQPFPAFTHPSQQSQQASDPVATLLHESADQLLTLSRQALERAQAPASEPTPSHDAVLDLAKPDLTITPVIAEPVGFSVKEMKIIDFAEQVYAGAASFEESDEYVQASKPNFSSSSVAQPWLGQELNHQRFLAENGSVFDLASLRDSKRVLMVVLRGFAGSVCPYCTAQTRALMKRIEDFKQADCEVLFVYPGGPDSIGPFLKSVANLSDKQKQAIRIFLDIDLVFIRSLGIEEKLAKPTSIVIDRSGLVTYAYVGKDLSDRPTVDHLLQTVKDSSP